eukprot:gene6023-701_t
MPRVFMATSYDTPDVPAGKGDPGYNVHSPYKQPAAARLARAGLAVAYGVDVGTYAPFWAGVSRGGGGEVTLTVGNLTGDSKVELRAAVGFEPATWDSVNVTAHAAAAVTVGGVPAAATKI